MKGIFVFFPLSSKVSGVHLLKKKKKNANPVIGNPASQLTSV